MAKKMIEGSAAEEAAESPAQEKAEQAKGDPTGTAAALHRGGKTGTSLNRRNVAKGAAAAGAQAPVSNQTQTLKAEKGGPTNRRSIPKAKVGR